MKTKDRGIRISPKYYQKDWRNLKLNENTREDWNTAIKIFMDRIEGRFLEQIKLLDENPKRKIGVFAGFAIMSLDCLLIETLEQFYKGKVRTGQGMNEKAFFNFFQRSDEFKSFFETQAKAKIFYQQIRCGLLHQAQTKKKSIIHIKNGKSMLEWIDEDNINEGIKIQRRLFHKEVVKIYEAYVEKISSERDLNFKKKFQKKMNYIVNQN